MTAVDLQWIVQQARPYRRAIAINLAIVGAIVLINFVIPITNREMVNVGVLGRDAGFVTTIVSVQAILYSLLIALHYIRGRLAARISNRMIVKMVGDFMRHVVRLPMSYFNGASTGDLVERIKDFERIQKFVSIDCMEITATAVSILSLAPLLAWMDWKLFAVFSVSAALYMAHIIAYSRTRKAINAARFRADARSRALEIGIIDAMQDIKIAGQEYASLKAWERIQLEAFGARQHAASIQSRQSAVGNAINRVGLLLIGFITAYEVIAGTMTIGDLTIAATIAMQLNFHIGHVLDFVAGWDDTQGALRRANELRRLQVELPRPEGNAASVPKMAISIANVSFSYPGTSSGALRNVSLELAEGQAIGIVGPSGSGKSTLLKLLLKLYAPDRGEIRVAGEPIQSLDVFAWRARVAAVMQTGALFATTLRENIIAGQPIDDAWLTRILRVAQLEELVDALPDGLETPLGANGKRLSAGQTQRILIARAIYKRPPLLLMDEATSALDTVSEARFLSQLRSTLPRSSIVMVAHRLSAIRNVDRLYVLQRGAVTEAGSHGELLAARGFYAELVQACS